MTKKQEEGNVTTVNIVEDNDYEDYLNELKKSREIEKQRQKKDKEEKSKKK